MKRTVVFMALVCSGCPQQPSAPAPVGETVSPKDSPVPYRVLKDETVNNSVEYHALVPEGVKHDEMQKLIEYLYRHLWTRHEDEPASGAAYVYTSETAYQTLPRTPIASAVRKSGDLQPALENRVPLEFWQEVKLALEPRSDEKWKLKLKVDRDDVQRTVVVTQPYTEPGEDRWAEKLSFNQAMQLFTDIAQTLCEKVPDLRALTFSGMWQDKEVVRIALTRSDYSALKLNEIDERVGQHHGRAFLELATGKKSDQQADRENTARIAKEYRAMLAQLKGRATVSPQLK